MRQSEQGGAESLCVKGGERKIQRGSSLVLFYVMAFNVHLGHSCADSVVVIMRAEGGFLISTHEEEDRRNPDIVTSTRSSRGKKCAEEPT